MMRNKMQISFKILFIPLAGGVMFIFDDIYLFHNIY